MLFSTHTWKPNDDRPAHKNKINLAPRTKNRWISMPTWNTSMSVSQSKTKLKSTFYSITEIKSIPIPTLISSRFRSMPPHRSPDNLDPNPKNKSFSSDSHIASQCRCLHRNRVNSDPRTEIKSISTTHTTTHLIWCIHWSQVKIYRSRWNSVNYQHKKEV